MQRAFLTAQRIADALGLSVQALPELREFRFGDWEGLTHKQICQQWPEIAEKFFRQPEFVKIPGGDSFSELNQRVEQVVLRLVKQHDDQTILVVSHGGTIRTILCAALQIPLDYVWSIRQDNTAVNIIEYYDERPIVSLVNDIHHLNA